MSEREIVQRALDGRDAEDAVEILTHERGWTERYAARAVLREILGEPFCPRKFS